MTSGQAISHADHLGAARKIACGVSVLTTTSDTRSHGTTASAVLAMQGNPVRLCALLRQGSVFGQLVMRSRGFVVNVLSADQEDLATYFASAARHSAADQFAAVSWLPSRERGYPMIAGSVATLECALTFAIPAGDHDVFVADVLDSSSTPGVPLLSFGGALHPGPEFSLTTQGER